MGLGSTAKKLQTVAEVAEKLYTKVNELREEVDAMRETVTTTEERVERLEKEAAAQRALLEALAHQEGIDIEEPLGDSGPGIGGGTETETDHSAPEQAESPALTNQSGEDTEPSAE